MFISFIIKLYCGHQRVQDTNSKGGATSKWLGQIQFCVRIIIIIIRIYELNIAVIDKLSDYGDAGSKTCSSPLKNNGFTQRTGTVIGSRACRKFTYRKQSRTQKYNKNTTKRKYEMGHLLQNTYF